ncbi:hypothetical protein X777_00485 [Ooceraea biroi]|uniref:SWIM-type domain-containing protein n=1 Tax=Ooceraea biroi TaxID=2015173 RepID=A0A026WTW2_OOCBI|nr:hypothetical protein X777_00485 [Ooceraea biroi]
MPLVKPMVGCSSDGFFLYVFGPFDATHNDATILQDCSQRYANDMSTIHEGLGQLNTAEANASRCVTKCRWVIEQVFGRLKKKFKIFSLPAHNTTLKHDLDSLYIAFALLNLFHKPILSDVMHEGIAQTLKSRLNVPNRLQIIVQEFNLPQLRVPFLAVEYTSLDNEENNRLIGFPELSMDDLYYLSLGPYQIRNAISYYAEHQKEGIFLVQKFYPRPKHPSAALNYEKYGISVEEPTLIKAHMKSRYRGVGRDSIREYYCTCESGARTAGCCSHVMTIVWFLGCAQYHGIQIPNPEICNVSITIHKTTLHSERQEDSN